ncbi:hypothetical protein P7C71_g6348, partial [Lecanoromycetidae sp. Uapishka_2]
MFAKEVGADSACETSYKKRRDPSEYATKDEKEAEDDFLAPARWWFFTTLFPLIAGTFGPVATAFSICAVTQPWRIVVDPTNTTEQQGLEVANPSWLTIVNALSLGIAIVTNLLMLMQMAEKIPYRIAAVFVIIGWWISSALLLGLVAAAPSQLLLPSGQSRTWSQAYYYAILAAAIYGFIGAMLAITAYGVYKGRYATKFKLTTAQRTLMLQTIFFIGYVLAAAEVYSYIEGWAYLDAGFGDYAPKTHLGRSLAFPMVIGGILFVGLIIGSIRSLVLQGGSAKISRRMLERARVRALQSLNHENGTIRVGLFRKHDVGNSATTELEKRRQEFNTMRKVQKRARRSNQLLALGVSGGAWIGLWIIGSVVFWKAEQSYGGWSFFDAIWFTYISFLTVGYGDFEPTTQAAKTAFVFWALLALPTLTLLIGAIGDNLSEVINSTALKIAEAPWLAGTTLQRGAIKAKKGVGSKHGDTRPPGFMEKEHGPGVKVDHPHFVNDKAHADAAHSMAMDFHHAKGVEANPKEVRKHRDKARRYRGYLLFKAVKDVVTHLDASPPRRYNYDEWSWFLKILGEDENNPKNHRQLHEIRLEEERHAPGAGIGQGGFHGGKEGETEIVPWSWLGPRSPLMSSTSEPHWLLERLMSALETELYEKTVELERREMEDEGDGEEDEGTPSKEAMQTPLEVRS